MKKTAICFTVSGRAVLERLNQAAEAAGIGKVEIWLSGSAVRTGPAKERPEAETLTENIDREEIAWSDSVKRWSDSVEKWAGERFAERSALIFVGAAGIAVRAIAGFVKDKFSDSPVIVVDDRGQFVIPILSGHAGGANQLAVTLAALIDAVPVVTTSTDIHGAFSADVFAREEGLRIRNRSGIRAVSAKAIEGKPLTLSIKNYPPEEPVDVIVADETDREYSLLLSPKPYTLGVGMKRDTDPAAAETFFLELVSARGIGTDEIYAVCTIDIKENEPAIRAFCDKYRLPLISFEAAVLARAGGEFRTSAFVRKTVGVDNVCERAAVLGAGPGAELVMKKQTGTGITAAIAVRRGMIGT